MCARPVSPGTLEATPRITGPTLWPNNVRYLAVDNRDLTTARVLVLGADRVLRVTGGDLTRSWPAADNFATMGVVATPTFTPGGASLSIDKIVVVRERLSNFVMGLTEDDRVVELRGSTWVASGYPIPAGVAWQTISGGLGALNLLATNGRMYRSVRGENSATLLPPVPHSLRALGIGGDFVITNANMNGSGVVPCVAPKNPAGFYDCGSTTERFFMLSDYGTWQTVSSSNIPLTNSDFVLTDGNPLTRFPVVEDARILHGDASKSLLTFHYNARVYHKL